MEFSVFKESPQKDSHQYDQLIFDEGAKAYQWRDVSLFHKSCWDNKWASLSKNKKRTSNHASYLIPKITKNTL